MHRAKTADGFYAQTPIWRAELAALRNILLSSGLDEEIKWGAPCYTLNGEHVVGVGAFKSYFGLWFYQGALLADAERRLVNAQRGRTKALRQWRMTSADEIEPRLIARYVNEAAALARSGTKVAKSPPKRLQTPPELSAAFVREKKAAQAFRALTPGRQREYADYIAEAKQPATKEKRIAKILPMIEAGVGLNDKYKSC